MSGRDQLVAVVEVAVVEMPISVVGYLTYWKVVVVVVVVLEDDRNQLQAVELRRHHLLHYYSLTDWRTRRRQREE